MFYVFTLFDMQKSLTRKRLHETFVKQIISVTDQPNAETIKLFTDCFGFYMN